MPGTVRIKHSPFSNILNRQGDIEILKDVPQSVYRLPGPWRGRGDYYGLEKTKNLTTVEHVV
jgi:hypothetical protein